MRSNTLWIEGIPLVESSLFLKEQEVYTSEMTLGSVLSSQVLSTHTLSLKYQLYKLKALLFIAAK